MARLSKKERQSLVFDEKNAIQRQKRKERTELIANGSYRPRSAVFSDKRRRKQEEERKREIRNYSLPDLLFYCKRRFVCLTFPAHHISDTCQICYN